MKDIKKYKTIFFLKNFINSIKSISVNNNDTSTYMMILEDNLF